MHQQSPPPALHFHQYTVSSLSSASMAKPPSGGGGCLEGLVFAFNAYSSFKNANIKELIVAAGGEISTNVTKKVDFLLCTSPLRDSSKVKLASRYGICLVREDYAVECIKANAKIPPESYILQPTQVGSDGNGDVSTEYGSDGELAGDEEGEHDDNVSTHGEHSSDDEDEGEDEEHDDEEEDEQSGDEDVHWCFEDDSGKWVEFERSASSAIEGCYKARLQEVKIDPQRYVDLKYMLLRHYNQPKRSNRLKRTCFGARVTPTSAPNNTSSTQPLHVISKPASAPQGSTSSLSHSTGAQPVMCGSVQPKRISSAASIGEVPHPKKQKTDVDQAKIKWFWQERSPYGKWVEYEPTIGSLLEEAYAHNQEVLRLDNRTHIDIKRMEQCFMDTIVHKCAVKREVFNNTLPTYLTHGFALGPTPQFKGYPLPAAAPFFGYPTLLSSSMPPTSRQYYQSIFPFQQNIAILRPLKEDSFIPGAHDKPSPIRMNTYRNLGVSFYELFKDRIFSEYSVLIGNFIGYSFFTKYAEEVLKARGFNVTTVTDEAEFVLNLPKSNVAWILSGNPRSASKENHRVPWLNTTKQKFADACLDYHKCGGGLFVWADNEPLFEQANTILPSIMKMELTGESPANQKLSLGNSGTRGQFGRHMITSGISRDLFEGISLCFPKVCKHGSDGDCGLMKVLATSTDDHPCILYSDVQRDYFVGSLANPPLFPATESKPN